MSIRPFAAFQTLVLLGCLAAAQAADCTIDATAPRQVIEGFGCTWQSEVFGTTDVLTASQRSRVVDALFNQVKVRLGQSLPLIEAPQSLGADFGPGLANDNADPNLINWAGFNTYVPDTFKSRITDLAPAGTANRIYPGVLLNSIWVASWLAPWYNATDRQRALDECGEKTLAMVQWWTTTYGSEPRWAHLTNEPFSGNRELGAMPSSWATDLVKTCGRRLRAAGFNTVKFVFSNDETEDISLNIAQAVLLDPEARSYVGAIGFHPYPYGSTYAKAANILATSGSGSPDAAKVLVRNRLRDLAAANGVEVWMTEVSHAEVDCQDFQGLRARAIHIHDEFTYANASAWFGMNSSWSRTAQQLHNPALNFRDDGDSLVMTDQSTDQVFISHTGYAIGHYARWLTAGQATRLDATSSDALVQITGFRDTALDRVVAVLINNRNAASAVNLALSGVLVGGQVTGEQSTASAQWSALPAFAPTGPSGIALTLPALSVTTISVAISGNPIAPSITTQPSNQTVTAGQTAIFTVAASGTPAPTWQWQRSDDGGSTWNAIAGATAAGYTTAATVAGDSGARFRGVATNGSGSATSNAAILTVNPLPDRAPVVAATIPAQTAVVGTAFGFTPAAGTFIDPDGDALTWSVAGMPGWLAFSAITHAFSGTPSGAGAASITITATDPDGASVSTAFALVIDGATNDPPALVAAISDQTVRIGEPFSFTIPAGTFADPEGGALTWSVSGLPAWLTFDAATRTIAGTCPVTGIGVVAAPVITVRATDAAGGSSTDRFTLDVLSASGGGIPSSRSSGTASGGCGAGGLLGLLGAGVMVALLPSGRRRCKAVACPARQADSG